jgi:uncharacterized lipoprotein YmbA
VKRPSISRARNRPRVLALAGLALTGAALSGCGHSAPTRIFTLAAAGPANAPASAYAGPPFRVDAVRMPAALDRLEVVQQSMAEELRVHDLAHWGAPPGDLARLALTQDLVARLPAGAVIYPDAPKPAGAASLVVDVLAFQRSAQGYVLDASWTLTPSPPPPNEGSSGQAAAPLRRQLRLTDPGDAGADDAGAEAAALSRLLGQLADAIATGVG